MTGISALDFRVLGPATLQALRAVLAFEKGICWIGCGGNESFPPVGMSSRQKERARTAFAAGRPFWDLVGTTVIVPLSLSGRNGVRRPDAAFVLEGVRKNLHPEEPGNWLPLLGSWLAAKLESLKHEYLRGRDGRLPPYLSAAVRAIGGSADIYALHVRGTRLCGEASRQDLRAVLESRLSADRGVRVAEAGHGYYRGRLSSAWFLIDADDNIQVRELLSRFPLPLLLRPFGVREIYLHSFPAGETDREDLTRRADELENAARSLGFPVFSTGVLDSLEERFGCDGLAAVFGRARAGCPGGAIAAAFAVIPGSVEIAGEQGPFHCCSVSGPCVMFLRRVPASSRNRFSLRRWGDEIREFVLSVAQPRGGRKESGLKHKLHVGVAASWQPGLKGALAPGAAFWAWVHAYMLGKGENVVFDAVTWQLLGDELMVYGAIQAAGRAYRNGLKIDARSAAIWNSLGVCLARLGRKREAERAFEAACSSDPSDFMGFYNLCGIRQSLGRLKDAEKACRQALDLCPGESSAMVRLGQLLVESGRYEEAIELLESATAGSSAELPVAWRLLGTAFYNTGRWSEAKQAFERVLKAMKDDTSSLLHLAAGYAEHEGDKETARRLAGAIMRKGHVSPELGRLYAHLTRLLAESSLDKEKADG